MIRPAWVVLGSALLLSACGPMFYGTPPAPVVNVAPPPQAPAGPRHLALLLPLSGPNAAVAQAMQLAAQMAAAAPGSPPLDIQDTGGDPQRAAIAAQKAIASGDAMILGPLTAEETQAVAAIAMPAQMPVLAFTSDPAAAQPGVWTLGVTPGQQMRRLVAAARDDGRQHIAALLPDGPFGDALESALSRAAADAGMEPPTVRRGGGDLASAQAALRSLSDYDSRRGALDARIKAMRESDDPASRQQAAVLAAQPAAPPPFDALVLGSTGEPLRQTADVLAYYDVVEPQVRVLGPALWAGQAGRLGALAGAWYAALDSASRAEFAAAYAAKYGAPAPPISDIAFDAVLIGRALAQEGDFSAAALTRPEGFSGVDGAMVLLPDGHVHRALALFQIDASGGAHVVSPAPTDLSQPGT
jgi:ABC-type branched-subunit amino acid transport system substrate-binding protein